MGLFGFAKSYASSRGAATSAMFRSGVSNKWSSVAGSFAGGSAYNRLRASSRSFYMRELLDTKLSKKYFKTMHKAKKKLLVCKDQKYAQSLGRLFSAYSNRPAKLKAKVSKLVQNTVINLEIFTKSYQDYIKVIYDELINVRQMSLMNDQMLTDIVTKLDDAVLKRNIYLPENILVMARDSIKNALAKQISDERKDVKESGWMLGAAGKAGAMAGKIWGLGHFLHKAKKNIKRFKNHQFKDFRKNMDELNRQLDSGEVSLVTLSLFVRHVEQLKKTQPYLEEIVHDAKLCLEEAQQDIKAVFSAIPLFLSVFKSFPEVQSVLKKANELQKVAYEYPQLVSNDEKNAEKMADYLDKVYNSMDSNFGVLIDASRKILFRINNKDNLNNIIRGENVFRRAA